MLDMLNYRTYLEKVVHDMKLNTCICCRNFSDKPYVIVPDNVEYDKEYVLNHKLDVIYSSHDGGVLVLFPNDIAFTWLTDKPILDDIMKDVLDYLKSINDKIVMDGNDIVLDGKKLFGTMSKKANICYEGMFFSFDNDIDMINTISKKEMKKIPQGLSTIGITPDDVIKLIYKLIDKYKLNIYGGDK